MAEFFSGPDLGLRSAQEYSFNSFFFNFYFLRFLLIASGTEIFWRVSFEILTSYGNIAFPLSPVLVPGIFFVVLVSWAAFFVVFSYPVR